MRISTLLIIYISIILTSNCIATKDNDTLENIYKKLSEARNKLSIIKAQLEALSPKNEATVTTRIHAEESGDSKDAEGAAVREPEAGNIDEVNSSIDIEFSKPTLPQETSVASGDDNNNNIISSDVTSDETIVPLTDNSDINKLSHVLHKLMEAQSHLHTSIHDLTSYINLSESVTNNDTPTQHKELQGSVEPYTLQEHSVVSLGRTLSGGAGSLRKRAMGATRYYNKPRNY